MLAEDPGRLSEADQAAELLGPLVQVPAQGPGGGALRHGLYHLQGALRRPAQR